MATDPVRIMIVDDHPLFRDGVRLFLETEPALLVVGEAESAEAALPLVDTLTPDIVLCDINLPGEDGLTLARRLRQLYPLIGIVMVTLYLEESRLLTAIRAGAAAFLTKDGSGAELLDTIARVARGEYPINDRVQDSPEVAARLLEAFRDLDKPATTAQILSPLTPREQQILTAIARGQSNKEIGRTLTISAQTVKNHVTAILRKLAVNDRTQAVMHSLKQGWLTLGDDGEARRRD